MKTRMRRLTYVGIVLASLIDSSPPISSAKTKDASLEETLLGLNARLAYAQSKAKSDASEIIELYGLKIGPSAEAETLYASAKADYDAILAELKGDLAERVAKPKPIDLTTAERDLNQFSTYAEMQIDVWVRKHPDAEISQADTTKARLSWNDSMTGTNAGAETPAAGGASVVSSISPLGTIVVGAFTALLNERDKLNDQSRKDEVAILETTRWLDWSAIANPKAPAAQPPNPKPADDVTKPKQ